MLNSDILILLERGSESLSYKDPIDSTQWAYNEGMQDLIISLENKLNKN